MTNKELREYKQQFENRLEYFKSLLVKIDFQIFECKKKYKLNETMVDVLKEHYEIRKKIRQNYNDCKDIIYKINVELGIIKIEES